MKRFIEVDESGHCVNAYFADDALPLPEGSTRLMIDVTDRPEATVAGSYDRETDTFTPFVIKQQPKRLSCFEFMQLLTPTEFLTMQARAKGGDTTLQYALAMLDLARYVEVGHPLLAQMFAYSQQINLFSAQRVDEIKARFEATAHA